ncbi:bifunctional diaminohydroxyphosphoribosylaminopyrimidine deaminase/5-amino-6-(5-phosphoribosylamino)uracil reductase RibD [Bacillus sp. FJAT-47783]|uniref:bifunctional diaminohydroxyphosphoribosylaminopyrimidine deaminase/5-amino-6-(5-phosphoribosylamino)uracil reductase RibD n=1 Tax=Bacillus sp. FJAT-47783 TaxID=2922712 RepID=UPI001FAC0CDC|nr:bifunctional diaminohydroxyphosphoribosylaminopyrimidine deaminase/5-amino-6-(5-phosphoribosylamino)uracil reductase RibD [Bacillus sp. FJAT-47783]
MASHDFYMQLALENARAMKGQTDPNPLVGAVLVNDNRIVGIGAHLKAGEPHAEIHALKMAGDKAKGSTAYVTLEPCSHFGRTGPCAVALVQAGVKKVVIATLDPNPMVSGRGVKILEEAGINVTVGVCEEEAKKMNEVFNKYIINKIPFVTMKAGSTLDGKIATVTSDSKWITSEQSRSDVHQLRHEHQAILVGANTVIKDNPHLTARIPNGRNPLRVVMDSTLRIPIESHVVTDEQAETWVFTSKSYDPSKKEELEKQGVKVFITNEEKRVKPLDVLKILGEHSISSLFIEGGGEIHASFLAGGFVDKVVLYIAPKLVGGKGAPSFLGGEGVLKMADAIELDQMEILTIGKDIKITGYPVYKKVKS